MGAQLDVELAPYASHRRLWPGPGPVAAAEGRAAGQGVLISTPLVADFRPGPEAVAEGLPTRRGVCNRFGYYVADCA